MKKHQHKLLHNQDGMAAILVTIVFVLIMTITVLSFSQISRREERQALDNQLSSQAFYAAEAGINEAARDLASPTGLPDPIPSGCIPQYSKTYTNPSQPGAVSSSCVIIDKDPATLRYGVVDTDKGAFTSLAAVGGSLSSVTFTWHDNGTDPVAFSGCSSSAPAALISHPTTYGADCDAGELRLQFTPASANSTRDSLIDQTFTVFLRPTKDGSPGGANVTYSAYSTGPNGQGQIIPAYCDATVGSCTATINSPFPAGQALFVNMRSIYLDNEVEINGMSGSTPAEFTNAQTVIDSTGRANDILKRLQVRIPSLGSVNRPNFTIDTASGVCKLIVIKPQAAFTDPISGGDPTCQIN